MSLIKNKRVRKDASRLETNTYPTRSSGKYRASSKGKLKLLSISQGRNTRKNKLKNIFALILKSLIRANLRAWFWNRSRAKGRAAAASRDSTSPSSKMNMPVFFITGHSGKKRMKKNNNTAKATEVIKTEISEVEKTSEESLYRDANRKKAVSIPKVSIIITNATYAYSSLIMPYSAVSTKILV
jgi:hypothetical protein